MFINGENDTCSLINMKGDDYCYHLSRYCDKKYFGLAIKYYCSQYYPSKLLTFGYSVIVLIILSALLLTLSVIVSNYFFRNLKSLAKILKINNQILSFLLIPLANAVPDMINYYISMDSDAVELMLGQVIGSTLISLSLIVAFIIMLKPFSVANYKIVIIDFFLLLLVLVMLLIIISDGKITLMECIFMASSYIMYLVYLKNFDKALEVDLEEEFAVDIEETMSILSNEEVYTITSPIKNLDVEDIDAQTLRRKIVFVVVTFFQLLLNIADHLLSILIPVSIYDEEKEEYHEIDVENENIKTNSKVYKILKKSWFFIEVSFILNYQFLHLEAVYILPVSLLFTSFSEYINFIEKVEISIINLAGILNSLIIISHISVHILQLLKNFGLILYISDYLLGLLVFAIGNSVNDMITNLTIATKVNPILGLNACLGTPILIILFGIGFNGIFLMLKKHEHLCLNFDSHLLVSTIGLIVIAIFYICFIPLNNWKFDRKVGAVLILFYIIVFTANCIL